MPEWLQVIGPVPHLEWTTLVFRLLAAMLFGLAIAGVYAATQRRPAGQTLPLLTTLVLLTILVAMTTIVIGDSIARAFGLVGALSIVRFRTVVDDTRDTSFVIFAVVVGMAIGAGNILICLIGVPVVSLVAFGLSILGDVAASAADRRLEIRVGAGRAPETLFTAVFVEHLKSSKLVSVVSARQGAAIDLIYRVRLRNPAGLLPLVKALQALEGVQSVDLKA